LPSLTDSSKIHLLFVAQDEILSWFLNLKKQLESQKTEMESIRKRQYFLERTLAAPIVDSVRDLIREEFSKASGMVFLPKYKRTAEDRSAHPLRRNCQALISRLQAIAFERGIDSKKFLFQFPYIREEEYQEVMNLDPHDRKMSDEILMDARLAVRPIIRAHMAFLDRETQISSPVQIPDPCEGEISRLTALLFEIKKPLRLLEKVTGKYGGRMAEGHGSVFSAIVTPTACVIRYGTEAKTERLLSFHQYLMIHDCVQARRNALLAAEVIYPEDHSLPKSIENSWKWQDSCISRYSNQGFEIAKATEALTKTYISRLLGDILSGPDDSFSNMLQKIRDKELKVRQGKNLMEPPSEFLADSFHRSVLQGLSTVQEAVEIFGTQKLCCHPTIDLHMSGKALQEIACAPDLTWSHDARRVQAIFRRTIVLEFIRQKHRWPKLLFRQKTGPMWRAYESQTLRVTEGSFPVEMYLDFEFCQEFDFEYFANYLELLDDKAVSFGRDEKHLFWDRGNPSSERRLLLEIFGRETFSIEEVIKLVEEDLVPVWMFIEALVVKEKEFKEKGRNFGLSYPDHREFFAATEANLAISILPLLPEISMTKGKLEIHREFLDLTAPIRNEDACRLFLELDLEAWNSRWRGLVVEGPGRDINQLFGMKRSFSYVHQYYEKSSLHLRSPGARPEGIEQFTPPKSDLAWTNHKGGVEGRAQKLWSILTVSTCRESMDSMNLSYRIVDQGDNIVLVVHTVRDRSVGLRDQLKLLEKQILEANKEGFSKVGQILKPEECLSSTVFLTYSKVCYGNGVDFPTTIKTLLSTKAITASSFPSIASEVGALFSGGYSAAEVSKRPERCYWYSLFAAALLLITESRLDGLFGAALRISGADRSPAAIRFALVCPSELGGYPVILPYDFFYRGGGDPLSKSIAGLRVLQGDLHEARQIISLLEMDAIYNEDPSFESLVKDPYGLPLRKPRNVDSEISELTFESLKSTTKNKDLKDLFMTADESSREAILSSIKSMTPFNPVVANDLYSCSIFGTIESIKKMFLTTQTVQRIIQDEEERSVHDMIIQSAEVEILSLGTLRRLSVGKESRISSVYNSVEQARSRWSRCGVTVEGITSYLPIDFEVYINPDPSVSGVRFQVQPSSDDLYYTVGKNKPYFGSATFSKEAKHGYKIIGRSAVHSSMRKLQSILSWSDHSPTTLKLIDYLSESRSGIKLSEVTGILSGVLGGDLGHRYEASVSERGAYLLGHATFASNGKGSTDHCGKLSATNEDYKVMFQEFLLYATSLAGYRWGRLRDEPAFTVVIGIGDQELEKLNMPPLSFGECNLDRPPSLGLKFAQSDSILIKRTTGYLLNDGFVTEKAIDNRCYEAAVVSKLLEGLNRRSVVAGIAGHHTVRVPEAFGLQEIRGIGVRKFLELASIAIYDCLAHHLPSNTEKFIEVASVPDLIFSYSALIIEIIARYWSHPEIQSDPFVASLALNEGLGYRRYNVVEKILQAEMTKITVEMIRSPRSLLFRVPIVVFGSDGAGATLFAYKRLLRRKLHQGVLKGEISAQDASFVVGSTIRRMVSSDPVDEPESLMRFSEYLRTYSWYKRGKSTVSLQAQTVAQRIAISAAGSKVLRIDRDSSELIREYRYRPPPRRITYSPFGMSLPLTSLPKVEIESGEIPPPTRSQLRVSLFQSARRLKRPYSNGASTVRAWSCVSEEFENRRVLIVGSGEGGCAVIAHIAKAKIIHGHDLRDDYPFGVEIERYLPPLMSFYRLKGIYRQTYESLGTTGDFFDRSILSSLLRKNEGIDVVVIDIPSERGRSKDIIRALIDVSYSGRVLIRVIGDSREHALLCGSILYHATDVSILETSQFGGISERIYCLTLPLCRFYELTGGIQVAPQRVELFPREKLSVRRLVTEIVAFSCSLASGSVRASLMAAIDATRTIIASTGTILNREDFSNLLGSALVCDILLDDSWERFLSRQSEIHRSGEGYITRLGNLRVLSHSLFWHLLERKASCLVGWLSFSLD